MKKAFVFSGLAAVLAAGLVGCHTCPPPEKSLECYPICKCVKAENARDVKAEWESFKNTPFQPFIPTRRYPKIDELGKIISSVSYQVKNEIVIPYIELDRDGLICGFYEFERNVRAAQKARNCDQQEAMRLVLEDWQRRPGGPEKCQKLVQALPVLHSLKASNQICIALKRVSPQSALRLTWLILADPTFQKELKLLQSDIKRFGKGDPAAARRLRRVVVTVSTAIPVLTTLGRSAAFLSVYLDDKSSQREAMEKFIQDIDRMSQEADKQHNR